MVGGVILFISEGNGIGCVSKQGLKKASLINVHSFIAEVKLKRRWRPGRRGGCLTPLPRKPHGKNISKHRSIKDNPLRRSSEFIAFVTLYQKDSPLRSSKYFFVKYMLYYFVGNIKQHGGQPRGGRGR